VTATKKNAAVQIAYEVKEQFPNQPEELNEIEELFMLEAHEQATSFLEGNGTPLLVGLTFIHNAAAKGAVCLDATLPG